MNPASLRALKYWTVLEAKLMVLSFFLLELVLLTTWSITSQHPDSMAAKLEWIPIVAVLLALWQVIRVLRKFRVRLVLFLPRRRRR